MSGKHPKPLPLRLRSDLHRITAEYCREAPGGTVEVRIYFTHHKGYAATWDEPGESDAVEFAGAEVKAVPVWQDAPAWLNDWAENWLHDHEDEAFAAVADARQDALERRAEMRADDARGER